MDALNTCTLHTGGDVLNLLMLNGFHMCLGVSTASGAVDVKI